MQPGRPARADYEYERNGTANLLMIFTPLEDWRRVKVTERRTAIDYAHALKDLSDTHFPAARKIVRVQHNLNTHKPASLCEAFEPAEARRLVERFEWRYTPKLHRPCSPDRTTCSPSDQVRVVREHKPAVQMSRLGTCKGARSCICLDEFYGVLRTRLNAQTARSALIRF